MVTTRSKTNSLPEKRVAPEIASAAAPKRRAAKSTKSKTSIKTSKTKSEPPEIETQSIVVSTTPPEANGPTTFLDLPPELRNEIYSYTLIKDHAITVGQVHPYILEPTLLAINHQIRAEAVAMWYGENNFEIDGSSPAVKFMRSLTHEKLRLLRSLRIRVTNVSTVEYARQRLRQLVTEFKTSGLSKQTLHFQVRQGMSLLWANANDLKHMVEDGAGGAVIPKTPASSPRKERDGTSD